MYIPEPRLDPPEDRIVHYCRCCQGEIYEGNEFWDIPGFGPVCRGCIDDAHDWGDDD